MPEQLEQPTHLFRTATSLAKEQLGRLERLRKALKAGAKTYGVPTGFKTLDACFNGLQAEKLYFLGGRPAGGKTSLALNIANNVAKQGYPVVFVACDEGARSLALKLACLETKSRVADLNRGDDPTNVETYISTNPQTLGNITFIENARVGMGELGSKMAEVLRDAPITEGYLRQGLLVVDYLQIMATAQATLTEGGKFKNMANMVEGFITDLRSVCVENQFACLCISALSRGNEGGNYDDPQLSSFRESSSIEFSADGVIALLDDKKIAVSNPMHARRLRILKNRDGDAKEFSVLLNGASSLMEET
jgi:replicative DNA helicase